MVQADSFLGRLALAARPGRPWFRITAPPRVARFLVAAGAQAAPASDAMKVTYSSGDSGSPTDADLAARLADLKAEMIAYARELPRTNITQRQLELVRQIFTDLEPV